MRNNLYFLLIGICLAGCAIYTSGEGSVLDVLRNQTSLTDFAEAVNGSLTLKSRLANSSVDSTVFAPINQQTPFHLTETELSYHVVNGRYLGANLTDGELLPTLVRLPSLNNANQQLKIAITNGTVSVNGVRVQSADIGAANGVVHTLESPLSLPGPLVELLHSFPTLGSLVTACNITFPASSTLFAPTDAAFSNLQKANPALFGYLTTGSNDSRADLEMVIKYHTLNNTVLYASNIVTGSHQENTLAGQSVTVSKTIVNNTAEVTVSSDTTTSRVVSVDTLAAEGVLHSIDTVLVPNDFAFSLKKILVGLNDTTLLHLLEQANLTNCLTAPCQYTIFAPSQNAWEKADENDYRRTAQLVSVLKSHIYNGPLPALQPNMTLTMLSNKTVHIVNNTLTLEGKANLGSARVIGKVTKGSNGYLYQIDQVLGVALTSDDSLSKATIGWIIVGGMGGILLLAAIIVAVVWYVKRKRAGSYEVIGA